jgi:PTH1 family peptidyl-tRNA hydrolase
MTSTGAVGPVKTRLIKPLTFMNLSGAVLKPYTKRAFWAPVKDLLVVVDEVALPLGKLRLRAEGSAGGHNGLKSVEHALGTKEYGRMRIGIAPEEPERLVGDLADFVLAPFGKGERQVILDRLPVITSAVETWLRDGITAAMNGYNNG